MTWHQTENGFRPHGPRDRAEKGDWLHNRLYLPVH
jgi:hypothetical protein